MIKCYKSVSLSVICIFVNSPIGFTHMQNLDSAFKNLKKYDVSLSQRFVIWLNKSTNVCFQKKRYQWSSLLSDHPILSVNQTTVPAKVFKASTVFWILSRKELVLLFNYSSCMRYFVIIYFIFCTFMYYYLLFFTYINMENKVHSHCKFDFE